MQVSLARVWHVCSAPRNHGVSHGHTLVASLPVTLWTHVTACTHTVCVPITTQVLVGLHMLAQHNRFVGRGIL
jgi:hypothetical protein